MSFYTIQPILDKAKWEIFILSHKEANFLQSWNWGSFHKKLGKQVFRFGIFDQEKQIGACEIIKEKAKRGTYLTIAGGPIINWQNWQLLKYLFNYLKSLAKKENCSFIRIRPQALDTPELRNTVKKHGLRKSPMHLTADLTLQLDLTQSEENILAKMRKNTRYEIKKSIKLGIKTQVSQNPDEIQKFYQNQLYLAKKHNFVPFSQEFLQNQFESFLKDDQVALIHSYLNNKILASAFIIFYNHEAVYHYGISTPENDHLPGSYACQWRAIRRAKKRGCNIYNFWGIAPKDEPDHRFTGVSIFKRGFGGQEIAYLPAHDLPISNSYYITKSFEEFRKKIRKL